MSSRAAAPRSTFLPFEKYIYIYVTNRAIVKSALDAVKIDDNTSPPFKARMKTNIELEKKAKSVTCLRSRRTDMAQHALQHTSLPRCFCSSLSPLPKPTQRLSAFPALACILCDTRRAAPEGISNVPSDKKASNSVIKIKVIRLNFYGLFLCR